MCKKASCNTTVIPYQLCPKCLGQGIVSRPPYVAADVPQWSSTDAAYTCDLCNGSKVILMFKVEDVTR